MRSEAFDGDFPITSPYGWRTHPITGERSFHDGIDVSMPTGTPLKAKADGTVRIATADKYGGKYIQVRMPDGRAYWQLHLSSMKVSKGAAVVKGQLIGLSGNSGNSTGPHTHFGLQSNSEVWNSNIDPTSFFTAELTGPAKFVKGDTLVFTDIQNIRKGSGTSYAIIRKSVAGEIFTVVDTPRQADGYNWYDTGNGWVADVSKFIRYVPPVVEPTPEPPTVPQEPETPPEVPSTPTEPEPPVEEPTEPTPEEPSTPTVPVEKQNWLIEFIILTFQRLRDIILGKKS